MLSVCTSVIVSILSLVRHLSGLRVQAYSFCVYYPDFVYRPIVSVCIVRTLCTGLQFLCVLSGLSVQAYSFCVYCLDFVYRPIVSVCTGL